MSLGDYIKEKRKEKKMSIRKLALYSGVSNAYISQIESGERSRPSPEILKKLSEYLNVSYEELMEKAGYIQVVKPSQELKDLLETSVEQKDQEANSTFNRLFDENDKEIDISKLLEFPKVTFEGIPITDQDRQRIRDFLTGFFLGRKS